MWNKLVHVVFVKIYRNSTPTGVLRPKFHFHIKSLASPYRNFMISHVASSRCYSQRSQLIHAEVFRSAFPHRHSARQLVCWEPAMSRFGLLARKILFPLFFRAECLSFINYTSAFGILIITSLMTTEKAALKRGNLLFYRILAPSLALPGTRLIKHSV